MHLVFADVAQLALPNRVLPPPHMVAQINSQLITGAVWKKALLQYMNSRYRDVDLSRAANSLSIVNHGSCQLCGRESRAYAACCKMEALNSRSLNSRYRHRTTGL